MQELSKLKFNSTKFEDLMEKIEKNFQYLNNPHNMPIAYEASMQEISRRREFDSLFKSEF